jgi:hypothetical protein
MKSILLAVAVLLSTAVVLRAEAPATSQPAADSANPINPPIGQSDLPTPSAPTGQSDSHRPGRGQRFLQPLTEKEVADAMQFMSQHSRNRFEAIQSLPDGEKKTEIKNFTARAYLNWMRMANDDSELYSVVMKRVELEDQIFGKVTLLKKETDPDKKQLMTDDLKSDVGKLLDIGLQERTIRLKQLANIVKKEQKQLEEDSANRTVLVDERLKAILKSGETSSLVPNGGGGGGQGPRARGAGRP